MVILFNFWCLVIDPVYWGSNEDVWKFKDWSWLKSFRLVICWSRASQNLQSWSKVYGTPWKFAVFIITPCSMMKDWLFFQTLAFPLPHTMLLHGGHRWADWYNIEWGERERERGGGGGGGRNGEIVKKKKTKCTMTFDQYCRSPLVCLVRVK